MEKSGVTLIILGNAVLILTRSDVTMVSECVLWLWGNCSTQTQIALEFEKREIKGNFFCVFTILKFFWG